MYDFNPKPPGSGGLPVEILKSCQYLLKVCSSKMYNFAIKISNCYLVVDLKKSISRDYDPGHIKRA